MDLHAPRLVRIFRLQRLGLPKATHLRSHEGTRILRQHGPKVQERIPVSFACLITVFRCVYSNVCILQIRQILGSLVSPRRYEGTFGWILGCQQPCWPKQGLRRILPMPLLHQGLCQEELERQQLVNAKRQFTSSLTYWISTTTKRKTTRTLINYLGSLLSRCQTTF